jgi:soluble lytic murein transglycosylase
LRRAGQPALIFLLILYVGLIGLRAVYPLRYLDQVRTWAEARLLDPALVSAVIWTESRFRADAVSPRGAIGLMQIMPETGRWIAAQIGVSEESPLTEPELNIRLGTWYLRYLINRFGDVEAALMAYNAGPGNVDRWRRERSEPFPETAAYAHRVLATVAVSRAYFRFPGLVRILPALPL